MTTATPAPTGRVYAARVFVVLLGLGGLAGVVALVLLGVQSDSSMLRPLAFGMLGGGLAGFVAAVLSTVGWHRAACSVLAFALVVGGSMLMSFIEG